MDYEPQKLASAQNILTQIGTFRWSHKVCAASADDDPNRIFAHKWLLFRERNAFSMPEGWYATFLWLA